MWSLVQYRQIGKQVEREWRDREAAKLVSNKYDDGKGGSSNMNNHPRSIMPMAKQQQQQQDSGSSLSSPNPATIGPVAEASSASSDKNIDNDGDQKILVDIQDDTDPLDPRNWPLSSRSKNIALLSLLIFVQGWAGAADSQANAAISREFGVSQTSENLSQAMYLFGIGAGSLFVGPLSETLGRNPVYLVSTFCYLFFVLGSALTPTFAGQVVCRWLIGLFASATLATNGASVSDQFRPVKRSFVFPLIAWANVAGPTMAPIAGGWIVSTPRLGWRWCEWVTLIISAAAFLIALLFLPETYLPILLDWKAQHLRRVSGSERYISQHAQRASFLSRLRQVLPMPLTFFATEPVIAVLGGYLILLYILLFSFLSGFDYIFKQPYHLTSGLTGSCFASISAGSTAFTLTTPWLYSRARQKTHFVSHAVVAPEFRLWPAIFTAPLLPIALFWLGWTNYPAISLWSGLGACFVFGIVATAVYVSSYEYIIDSYGRKHGALALASITMARYLIAGGMVMAARPMYDGIGVHWVMTILGCIAAVLAPAPLVFRYCGERLRAKSPYAK